MLVQEMEEREKLVKHMWDVYTNSRRIRMHKFWQEAFEAAFEDLSSDVPGVREDAIAEIAKMSIRFIDPPPAQSMVSASARRFPFIVVLLDLVFLVHSSSC